ncbi:hypothetical protein Tco_0465361 [Tanacetum coccineum]
MPAKKKNKKRKYKYALGTNQSPNKKWEPKFQTPPNTTVFKCKVLNSHALVSDSGCSTTYDGESFKAHEFCGKFMTVQITTWRDLDTIYSLYGQFCGFYLEVAFKSIHALVRDINGADILKYFGKSKKFFHLPKSENTNMEVLHTLHMDLCGPMRVQSINGRHTSKSPWMTITITWQKSIPRTLNKTELLKDVIRTLVESSTESMDDILETIPCSAQSSSGNVNAAEPNQVNYPPDHIRRWTKDHPLDNIVGNPSRPVSTRKQLIIRMLCGAVSILN